MDIAWTLQPGSVLGPKRGMKKSDEVRLLVKIDRWVRNEGREGARMVKILA